MASLLAGERSGNLDAVLRRFVEYTKIIDNVKRKTLSALVYPAILITLALGIVLIIVLYAVPAFSDFYSSFGADLPLVTRIIVRTSAIIRSQFVLLLAGGAGLVLVVLAWVRRPGQRAKFDHLLLGLPMLGGVARKFATSQMARTLATLLGGGIPLVNSLEIAGRSMTNRFLAGELSEIGSRVREGESFASAMLARRVFPDVAVKMVEVGESTGALQEMLNSLAEFYDEEIETEVGRFITLVEPLMLVIMGIVIAMVVLALYMPLFELSSVVS
jgi:type IV pilus assembly protein PilC